jgi:hypothetical protein
MRKYWFTKMVLLMAVVCSTPSASASLGESCSRESLDFTVTRRSRMSEAGGVQSLALYLDAPTTLETESLQGLSNFQTLAIVNLLQTLVDSGLLLSNIHFFSPEPRDEQSLRLTLLMIQTLKVFNEHPSLPQVSTHLQNQFSALAAGQLSPQQLNQLQAILFPEEAITQQSAWAIMADHRSATSELVNETDRLVATEIVATHAMLVLEQIAQNENPELNAVLAPMRKAMKPDSNSRLWTEAAERLVGWHVSQAANRIKSIICETEPSRSVFIVAPDSTNYYRIYRRELLNFDFSLIP